MLINSQAFRQAEPVIVTNNAQDTEIIESFGGLAITVQDADDIERVQALFDSSENPPKLYPLQPQLADVLSVFDFSDKETGLITHNMLEYGNEVYNHITDNNAEGYRRQCRDYIQGFYEKDKVLQRLKRRAERDQMGRSALARLDSLFSVENIKTPKPTGFKELDSVLNGGLYAGLYVIGAVSSLGKTAFTMQIADQLAQQGHDVFIFTLEMSEAELIARSISRESYKLYQDGGVSGLAIQNPALASKQTKKTEKVITESKLRYAPYAQHLFFFEGIGDIDVKRVEREIAYHKNVTGRTPVVIIDYLQALAPADIRASDKQNTDKAVFTLKRISRELDTPVLAISSMNRESYKPTNAKAGKKYGVVSTADFKESGAIEYTADVLIGLQYTACLDKEKVDLKAEGKRKDRNLAVSVLKNRNGTKDVDIEYTFLPKYSFFMEQRIRL